jgi:2-polyprenyl-3-methyl-5-hydroxy-6-metoxy-1,4-benzoquinol methylase
MRRDFDPAEPELMDQAELLNGRPTAELQRDLANLRWLNRHFGAISILHRFLNRWLHPVIHDPRQPRLRVLDLATGEGDLPRELVAWCRKRGIPVTVDAVDANAATLAVAQELSLEFPEINFHQGDIRSWQSSTQSSWDLVLCSLALHHFSSEDAVKVLRHARELTSRHLLVADLKRSRMGALGIWLLTAIFLREPMTVHDARLSIRRAFSRSELALLARDAGWEAFEHADFPVTRQAIWIDQVPTAKL